MEKAKELILRWSVIIICLLLIIHTAPGIHYILFITAIILAAPQKFIKNKISSLFKDKQIFISLAMMTFFLLGFLIMPKGQLEAEGSAKSVVPVESNETTVVEDTIRKVNTKIISSAEEFEIEKEEYITDEPEIKKLETNSKYENKNKKIIHSASHKNKPKEDSFKSLEPGTYKGDTTNTSIDVNGIYIPEYSVNIALDINDGIPFFTASEINKGNTYFIELTDLDSLGRCGANMMSFKKSDMPSEERGAIGNIRPSGWIQAKYDTNKTGSDSVYLYNRAHLLGYFASGLNDDDRNLITGTRQFNLAMLDYVETPLIEYANTHPKTHILYRVTPIFFDNELVARGVLMEAISVEDNGESLKICKFIYNVENSVTIDYKTGKSTGPMYEGQ